MTSWQVAASRYLERLGFAEWSAWKTKKRRKSEKWLPSEYHRELVELLGRNDEVGFKTLKGEQGYAGILGH